MGRRVEDVLELDLWLMSCRVLKRDMELAMLDALVENTKKLPVRMLRGRYIPTKKNGMVADHYSKLGFEIEQVEQDGTTTYLLDVSDYKPRNTHIVVAAV